MMGYLPWLEATLKKIQGFLPWFTQGHDSFGWTIMYYD
jgi:hypothetical protein